MIEIMTNGALNLVQDLGRHGHLHLGVSQSGAMDEQALRFGNCLLGNPEGAAGIEINLFPFKVCFKTATQFACTGADCKLSLDGVAVAGWWCCNAQAGQVLTVERPRKGSRAYLCIAGGIDVVPIMGSRATDLKAGFGGFQGRGLMRGDQVPLGRPPHTRKSSGVAPATRRDLWRDLTSNSITVRVLRAAEFSFFNAQSIEHFFSSSYRITPQSNRIGYRLEGEPLCLDVPRELRSHGILPGTVQVPPAGQPIVQMAEANTCGGYPKIANVIQPDLWRIAQAPIGASLRFTLIDEAQALDVLREHFGEFDRAANPL